MKITGIVGSPRKERGITNRVVKAALKGAEKSGAKTEIIYLRDEGPDFCIHCEYDCFFELNCKQEDLKPLFNKIEKADGMVLGAPVYIWQANGLTTSFFDKFRLSSGPWDREQNNNKSALGIAVAGGTGTGVFPALKSIYSFLNLWEFNPVSPLPVTRFNLEKALIEAEEKGRKMGSDSIEKINDTPALMAAYEDFKYLNFSRKEEFKWLAQQILLDLENTAANQKEIENIKAKIKKGDQFLKRSNKAEAISNYMEAYKQVRRIWENQ